MLDISIVFDPFLKIFTWVYDHTSKGALEKKRERREIFEKHVSPAFQTLSEIHADYMLNFESMIKICKKMQTPNKEMLTIFREYSVKYSGSRSHVRSFSKEFFTNTQYIKNKRQKQALERFGKSIEDYFNPAIYDTKYLSWFSFFIGCFEECVDKGVSPWDYHYSRFIGMRSEAEDERLKKSFVSQIEYVGRDLLPKRWEAVTISYERLRMALCYS